MAKDTVYPFDEEDTTLGNDAFNEANSPEIWSEQMVSGDDPDPASDDDTLENEHQVGLKMDEDPEHPKPLDIASDIEKAEEYKKTH